MLLTIKSEEKSLKKVSLKKSFSWIIYLSKDTTVLTGRGKILKVVN